MKQRLRVNRNHVICLETIEPGRRSSRGADDLRFNIELHTTKGWTVREELSCPRDAARAFREQRSRNPSFRWRLMAVHPTAGAVMLPNKWLVSQGSYA